MGLLAEIAERQRQAQTRDTWFTKQGPYVLELRTSARADTGVPQGRAFMTLPLGPEGYKVRRVYRQSVTPTLGGLVAEEQGLLWREITVRGTFGLEPKFSQDTSEGRDTRGSVLSGPLWTRRMIRNFFNKYAALKADSRFASATTLIWHDTRTDDHWVVVPEDVDVDRTTARRLQYPYTFKLKATGDADGIVLGSPTANVLAQIFADVVGSVRRALGDVSAALQDGSRILGEVRFTVAQIDSVIDDITTIVRSAEDFVEGVTATISVGRTFVSSVAQQLDAVLSLMETAEALPAAVRQNYQMAQDGLHAIAATAGAFGSTYAQQAARIEAAERGPAGDSQADLDAAAAAGPPESADELAQRRIQSTDRDRLAAGSTGSSQRVFARYASSVEHVVTGTDSLPSLASQYLGDGRLWYDIAVLNGLKPPYVSATGGEHTARPGDTIVIPQVAQRTAATVAGAGAGPEPGLDILGTDIRVAETAASRAGRPAVDMVVDQATHRDVQTVSRVANLAQALQVRTWTERGRLPYAPGYGLLRAIGIRQTAAFATLLQLTHRETVQQDARVDRIVGYEFDAEGDVVEVDLSVIPVGATNAQAISTSLV